MNFDVERALERAIEAVFGLLVFIMIGGLILGLAGNAVRFAWFAWGF